MDQNHVTKVKRPQVAIKFANVVFITGICFSILIAVYAIYKIYNIPENLKLDFYLAGILFGVVFSILFGLGLRMNDNLKVNLSLAVIATVISIYAIEIYLYKKTQRITEVQSKKGINEIRKDKAREMNLPYDSRTLIEVLNDLKKEGIEAYPKFYPSELLKDESTRNGLKIGDEKIFPLSEISNQIIVQDNENGYWMKYKGDKFGFHNPEDVYGNSEVDIAIVGDSFAEGFAVKSNENISSVLRKDGFSIVNMGKTGNGPLLELATLKEYVKPLKPKIVLWLYFVNDIEDLNSEINSPILKRYLNEDEFSQNLRSRQKEIDRALKNFIIKTWEIEAKKETQEVENNWKNKILHIPLLRSLRSKINLEPKFKVLRKEELEIFERILEKSRNIVSSWGGKMYFVYLPRHTQHYSLKKYKIFSFNKKHVHRDDVLNIVTKLNIPTIDIVKEVFDDHPDPLSLFPFRMFGHYNAEGYRLVADAIKNKLSPL